MIISTKDLIDSKTSYSTTRWGFVVCVKAAIAMAVVTLLAWIVLTYLGKPTEGLLGGAAALIGVIIGIATTGKALQGFETRSHDDKPNASNDFKSQKNDREEVL